MAIVLDGTTGVVTPLNGALGATTPNTINTTGITFADATTQTTAAASRSGASAINLSSGTPNATLTSSSTQLQVISATSDGCSVTLPAMTTVSPVGTGYFTLYNTSTYPIAIKDSGGTVREIIAGLTTVTLNLRDNSTATGVWQFSNPINVASFGASLNFSGGTTASQPTAIIPVTATQFVVVYNNGSSPSITYAKLGTINTTTKAITFGSAITVYTSAVNKYSWSLSGTSDRVSRGFISIGEYTAVATATSGRVFGFAIVAGTLYVSAATAAGDAAGTANSFVKPTQCDYLGSNNSFFLFTCGYNQSASVFSYFGAFQFTVNVSGTTVSLTMATGNTTFGLFSGANLCAKLGRTGTTSYVVDVPTASQTFSTGYYINCNTSTNTLTQGTRTAQSTAMMYGLTQQLIGNNYQETAPTSNSFAVNSTGTRVFYNGTASAITNPGTASVTVALATDITYKSFPSATYKTLAASDYPIMNTPLTSSNGGTGLTNLTGFSASASNFVISNSTNYLSLDPSVSTFNINSASVYTNSYTPIFFSQDTLLCYSQPNLVYDFIPVATPIKS